MLGIVCTREKTYIYVIYIFFLTPGHADSAGEVGL